MHKEEEKGGKVKAQVRQAADAKRKNSYLHNVMVRPLFCCTNLEGLRREWRCNCRSHISKDDILTVIFQFFLSINSPSPMLAERFVNTLTFQSLSFT